MPGEAAAPRTRTRRRARDDLDVYEGQRECRHCGYERTVIINHGCGLYLEPAQYLTVPLDSSGIPDDGKNTFERSSGAAFFGKLKAPRGEYT